MAGQLAAVPEQSTNGFTAPCPRRNIYWESIRSVVVFQVHVGERLFSQPGNNRFSYSGDSGTSNSCPSNNSGSSYGSAAAASADLGTLELTKIARRMISDGYTQRMIQAFEYGGDPDRALATWFFELDVDWVLQLREGHGFERHLRDRSASALRESVERWIRALTLISVSITELTIVVDETLPVARFGKACMAELLVFIDAIVHSPEEEKLGALLDMYICVSGASHNCTRVLASPEAQSIFDELCGSLSTEGNRLSEAISGRMEEVRTLMEEDDSWAIEIRRGGGEVHRNTRFMMDCIVSMRKAQASTPHSASSLSNGNLTVQLDDTIDYLKNLLQRKSKLCSDLGLRYLFLLNNSHFVKMALLPWSGNDWKPEIEYKSYIHSFFNASWGHVRSRIPKTFFAAPLQRWRNTSSVAKFESAFHKTYQAQKLWKVPEPWLRAWLRKTIARKVISGYRNYLKQYPELEKHDSSGRSCPDIMEEMLEELFEG